MMPSLSSANVCVRFAPSPTGFMHLGSLRTALYNYLFAKKFNGTFLLRIEDTDQSRLVPSAVNSIVDTLKWSGLNYDVGPIYQSSRFKLYNDKVTELIEKKVAYRCFCSQHRLDLLRKEAAKNREKSRYDRRCYELSKLEVEEKLSRKVPFTVRFKLEDRDVIFNDMVFGRHVRNVSLSQSDPIILKSDGFPTYHLANVVDDNDMKITHVLRGSEWLDSTTLHIMLYDAFEWNAPQFAHLPLIVNKDGSKLSKRTDSFQVDFLRKSGYLPKAILNFLRSFGGGFQDLKSDSIYSLEEMIASFNPKYIVDHPAKMDFDKLNFYSSKATKEHVMDNLPSLVTLLRSLIDNSFGENVASQFSDEYLVLVLNWSKDRLNTINDLVTEFSFLWTEPMTIDKISSFESAFGSLKEIIDHSCNIIRGNGSKQELIPRLMKEYCETNNVTYSKYMQFIRTALTGLKDGPPVVEIITLLGVERSCQRLKNVMNTTCEKEQIIRA